MDREQLYNQIEAYLADELSSEEKRAFEISLQSDPELAAEVELHRRLDTEFGDPQKNALILQLEEIEQAYEPRRVSMWPRMLAIAASVVLLLGFAYYFFIIEKGPVDMPIVEEESPKEEVVPPTPQKKEKEEVQLAEEKPTTKPEEKIKPPEKETVPEVKEVPEELMAFGQNKELEALGNAAPVEEWKVTIYLPEKEVSFLHAPNTFNSFICTGVLKTRMNPNTASFSLQVVDNKKQVILKKALPLVIPPGQEEELFTFASEVTFPFETKITLKVPPGRYYLMILKDDGTTLAVRPFTIQGTTND